ncbi:MAG: SDR family NAD(P)-dependent oxidoreductase [Microbacteriaceae bacterium]|nr:SDR family NAD(P)-dependent oxidoreductase [Microbacteriaceae bacterium]
MDFSSKRILVVGASGVLGAEITRMLTAKGAQVLATARTQDSAANIPAEAAVRLLVDLTSSESISVLTSYLTANEDIDGVILAAGRVGFGFVADTSSTDARAIMQINFHGPSQLVTELLPALKGKDEAFVAAITGVVAEKTFAGMAAYCASKSALAVWLGALALEIRRDKITVVDARPGHTETGLATRPLFGAAPQMPEGMTPAQVAARIISGIEASEKVISSSEF